LLLKLLVRVAVLRVEELLLVVLLELLLVELLELLRVVLLELLGVVRLENERMGGGRGVRGKGGNVEKRITLVQRRSNNK